MFSVASFCSNLHGGAGESETDEGDAIAVAGNVDAGDRDRPVAHSLDRDLAEAVRLSGVIGGEREGGAFIGGPVEVDLARGGTVDVDLGATPAGDLEERDLGAVVAASAARAQRQLGARTIRNRVEAGKVEAFSRVGLLQRFVVPAVAGDAFEQRRAHPDVGLAGNDVGLAADAKDLLESLAHPSGEHVGRGVAIAELQDRQAMRFEDVGLEIAVGGRRRLLEADRSRHGGVGQRRERGLRRRARRLQRRRTLHRRLEQLRGAVARSDDRLRRRFRGETLR